VTTQEAGIPEYWLIDPQSQWAEFYQRDERGRFQHAPLDPQGIYRSRVIPGFWLRVDWLWQDPLPPVDVILLEIGGEAYARRLIERLREQGWL
jgi:hypothetical protein